MFIKICNAIKWSFFIFVILYCQVETRFNIDLDKFMPGEPEVQSNNIADIKNVQSIK